jgi:hypothetical protein
MSKTEDKKIIALRKKLTKKLELLERADKPTYLTGGLFRPNHYSDRGNINIKLATEAEIRSAAQGIVTIKAADALLDLDNRDHLGFPLDSWIEDLKTRLAVIKRIDTLNSIKSLKQKVDSELLTTSQKRTIKLDETLEKVADILGTD